MHVKEVTLVIVPDLRLHTSARKAGFLLKKIG